MSDSERRRGPRRPLKMRIDYKAGDGDFLYEYTRNISEGGLFVATDAPPKVGTVIQMRFQIPGENSSLKVEGKVKWVNASKDGREHPNPGMGVEFINLSDEERDIISHIVGAIAYL